MRDADSSATIRVASTADLDEVLRLMRGYYADDGLAFELERASTTMSRLLNEPHWGRVLLLESHERPIGYVAVCLGFSLELGGNDAFIDEIYVVPEFRGRGHGKRLLEAAAASAREMGVQALHLEVDRTNHVARELYDSLGYRSRDRYCLMTKT